MHRCGAETTTTNRPCATHVPAPGVRCPRHRPQARQAPGLATVTDLNAWRKYRTYAPAYRAHQAAR